MYAITREKSSKAHKKFLEQDKIDIIKARELGTSKHRYKDRIDKLTKFQEKFHNRVNKSQSILCDDEVDRSIKKGNKKNGKTSTRL